MPKSKSSKKKSSPSKRTRVTRKQKRSASLGGELTDEYREYLERYELYGEGRPRLRSTEFNRLDEELLDLLALGAEEGTLSDDQLIRVRELEYLLIDDQSDSARL